MCLSSGQWNVRGRDGHHFWAWPLKSPWEFFFNCWWVIENSVEGWEALEEMERLDEKIPVSEWLCRTKPTLAHIPLWICEKCTFTGLRQLDIEVVGYRSYLS